MIDLLPQNPAKPSDSANAQAAAIVNATQINAAKMAGMSGLGSGGNTFLPATATAAERAHNFRASLDRERAAKREAANPGLARASNAILDETMGNAQKLAGGMGEYHIDPPTVLPTTREGEYEQRIAMLEASVNELLYTIREMTGPLQKIFPAIPNPSNTNQAQWQEATVQGTSIVTFQDGRHCLSGTAAGQILDPGSTGVFALLEIPNGSNRAYLKIGGGIGMIPVALTVSTGTNGTQTTKSSWTYDCVGIIDAVDYGVCSQQVDRPNGNLLAASFGIGYKVGSTFSLLYAFEIRGTTACAV